MFPGSQMRQAMHGSARWRPAGGRGVAARLPQLAAVLLWAVGAAGCQQQMSDQPRLEPLEASEFFADGRGSRHPVAGTVPRGNQPHQWVEHSPHFLTGLADGEVAETLPEEMTREQALGDILARGQQRYEIFCAHCHDLVGTGRGMVPQRGYPEAATYHSERLRTAPLGHFFRVITDGRGRMPAHGPQIPPADRWAIAAYVRALQLSQHAQLKDLPPSDQQKLPPE